MTEKIYVTGKVEGITKKELKEIIKPDFQMASGVIKSLKYLVIADNPGEKRIQTAKDYGIETISWDEFLKIAKLEEKIAKAQQWSSSLFFLSLDRMKD